MFVLYVCIKILFIPRISKFNAEAVAQGCHFFVFFSFLLSVLLHSLLIFSLMVMAWSGFPGSRSPFYADSRSGTLSMVPHLDPEPLLL